MRPLYGKLSYAVFLLCILAVFAIQNGMKEKLDQQTITPEHDLYFTADPEYLKLISFGFEELVSDIYWINTMLYFGRNLYIGDDDFMIYRIRGENMPRDYSEWYDGVSLRFKYLTGMVDIVTGLDPYFEVPYMFAAVYLSAFGNAEKSIEILNRGAEYLKDEWLLPYWIGFNYYFYLEDKQKAAEYFVKAAAIPGAKHTAILLAQNLFEAGNKKEAAVAFLTEFLEESDDPGFRQKLERMIEKLKY